MSLTLRPYQSAAIQGIYNYFQAESGNPLVVIPILISARRDFIRSAPVIFATQRIRRSPRPKRKSIWRAT